MPCCKDFLVLKSLLTDADKSNTVPFTMRGLECLAVRSAMLCCKDFLVLKSLLTDADESNTVPFAMRGLECLAVRTF